MDNNLWPSADEINNYITSLGSCSLSIVGKELMMKDKVVLASKYMLAQALEDFDKSNLQNIIDNVKYHKIKAFQDYKDDILAIYVPKNNGFFAILSNLGVLLDFNFEIKPKTKRKTLRSLYTDFMDFLLLDAPTRALIKERETKYDCNITINILDPLKKFVSLYDLETTAHKMVQDIFFSYSNLYELPYRDMKAEYVYNIKKAQNSDYPLFDAFANGELDADEYLPSFYVLINEKTTRINNSFKSEHYIAIEMLEEWAGYTNNDDEYANSPISKRLDHKELTYNIDILVKKYVGIPISLSQKGDSKGDTIVTFHNINRIDRDYSNYYNLPANNVFTDANSVVLIGCQHYNSTKDGVEHIIRTEAERFKTDYEQYIKEYADFINVFKLGAENLANDLWDTHLTLRRDFQRKLEYIDNKLSTTEVI